MYKSSSTETQNVHKVNMQTFILSSAKTHCVYLRSNESVVSQFNSNIFPRWPGQSRIKFPLLGQENSPTY